MNLNELTLGQIKELQNLFSKPIQQTEDCPFEIGEKYLIRTVTFTYTGQVKSKNNTFLVLQDCDWIADTGRFSEALENQDKFNEVEPFKNDVIISKGSIVDATKIVKLIRKMK
jgi:spore maturation protein CgeB